MSEAPPGRARSELRLRVQSAIVLIVVVLAATWFGSFAYRLLWVAAASVVLFEWLKVSGSPISAALRIPIWAGFGLVAVAILFPSIAATPLAGAGNNTLIALAFSVMLVLAIEAVVDRRGWAAAGLAYALAPAIAFVALRESPIGLAVTLFLFGVVWGADIFAFFVGRALKGPKLAPRISPGKTWSGALGGVAGALAIAAAVAPFFPGMKALAILPTAALLSVVSQIGDLGESAFKRRFGVKDSGKLIPGHGGVMDRVDALAAAAVALYLLTRANGGLPPGFG